MKAKESTPNGDTPAIASDASGQCTGGTGTNTSARTAGIGTSGTGAQRNTVRDQKTLLDRVTVLIAKLSSVPATEWAPQTGKVATHIGEGLAGGEGIEYQVISSSAVEYRIVGRFGVPMPDWIEGRPSKFLRHLLADAHHFLDWEESKVRYAARRRVRRTKGRVGL